MYELAQATDELIEAGNTLYRMGMVPATSGNFSARLVNGDIAITVSGAHKGKLSQADIMLLDPEGKPRDARKPSAETALHTQIYSLFPKVNCVLHPHAMNAVLLSKLRNEFVVLQDYELLKAFAGVTTHNTSVRVPIFPNDQDIPRLARQAQPYLEQNPDTVAYIIAGHGFYTWGDNVATTMRHIEALDYLFACEMALERRDKL